MSPLNFKIVYALVSHPGTYYAEQCYLSIYSLRKIHPDAHVVIMLDRETANTCSSGIRALLKSECQEFIIRDFNSDISPLVRSRLIKTSLRQTIKGNFLYVDTDTLFRLPLTELNDLLQTPGQHIWNVRDGHRPLHQTNPENEAFQCKNAALLGYDLKSEYNYFFNGGVSLVKDTPESQLFYEKWHSHYKRGVRNHNLQTDQASLCLSNIQCDHIIHPMSPKWNFQIVHQRRGIKRAAILHYFATDIGSKVLPFPMLDVNIFEELSISGRVPFIVDKCISSPLDAFDYLEALNQFIRRRSAVFQLVNKILKPFFLLRRDYFRK